MEAEHQLPPSSPLSYVYGQLPDPTYIRLLKRLGDAPDGTPSFSITLRDIKDEHGPQYHCLSYTWGNPYAHGASFGKHFRSVAAQYDAAQKTPILLDGRVLRVQRNLLDALAGIPHTAYPNNVNQVHDGGKTGTPEELIWADAICINQEDVDEKSTQVTMMDRIYSEAAFVVAWLGPEDEHTETGVKTLATLAAHSEQFKKSGITPYGGHDQERYSEAGMPLVSWSDWVGLASIFQRQWFRRAWIVQEAVLPGVLVMYLGSRLVSWQDLGTVSQMLRRKEAELGTSRSSLFVPQDEVGMPVEWNSAEMFTWRTNMSMTRGRDPKTEKAHQALFTLGKLVNSFWTFLASEPKDNVFSLYGILNGFGGSRVETDYRLSVASVFTSATRRIIAETGDLQILCACVYAKQRRDGLPSWVPDFGIPGVNAVPPTFSADAGLVYRQPEQEATDSPVLKTRGCRVGSIRQVGGRIGTGPGDKLRFDPSWLKLALSLKIPHAGEDDKPVLSEILWRTLCMDMSYGSFFDAAQFGPRAPDEFGTQFMIFMLLMIQSRADRLVLDKLGIEPTIRDELTVSRIPYNPFDEDLVSVLEDLEAFTAHDGDKCCTPPAEGVVQLWDSVKYTVSRSVTAKADGSPVDVYLPEDVLSGETRLVGSGTVNSDTKLFGKCRAFGTAYWMAYGGRQLFTVDHQYLGMGPLPAAAGDEVWILPGMKSPAILRPVLFEKNLEQQLGNVSIQDGAPRYHFVGSAYVHGLMHGEAGEKAGTLTDLQLV